MDDGGFQARQNRSSQKTATHPLPVNLLDVLDQNRTTSGMNPSHICLACRRRLGALRPPRPVQWQHRGTFTSLSNNTRTTTDEKATEELLILVEEDSTRKGAHPISIPAAIRRVPCEKQNNRPADDLEKLFEKSLHAPSASEKVPSQLATALESYKNAETLKEMLSGSAPLTDAWNFFVEHFGPDVEKLAPASTPSYLNKTAQDLLRRIIHAKKSDPLSERLPSVTEVSRVYLRLLILSGVDWSEMMFPLLESILRVEQAPSANTNERLIADTLGAWNVVCRRPGTYHHFPPLGSDLNWSYVPYVSSGEVNQMYRKRGPQAAFGILTPSLKLRHLQRIPMVALATFTILTNNSIVSKTHLDNASPFVSLLSQIVDTPGLTLNQVFDRDGCPAIIAESIKSNWAVIKERASQMSETPLPEPERPINRRQSSPDDEYRVGFINKRLQYSLKRGNVREVNELWSDVVQWPVKKTNAPQPYSLKRGTLTKELCHLFILVYMSLRQPNIAIDVWNHMLKSGLQPNLQTWDNMLSGCKASRDWKTLEVVWKRMLDSGAQPDVVCWTTRISGLIEGFQVDLGIRALDEMGRIWLRTARKQHPKMKLEQLQLLPEVDGAVKPTIETINAAVAGLFNKQSPDAAHRVLAWGGKFGIAPDLITYNTLLRQLIRNGHVKQATALLQQMQKAGIQADVATFTTILDETFRYSKHDTAEEQKAIIDSVFSEMEEAGVEPNLHTYGKIIYELLQNSHGDMSAVNAVMARMTLQGLEPSSQIYTMMVGHYFKQSPVNLDAVRGIIERANMVEGSTDHKFWDRVVEGYAQEGETAHALRILGNVHGANQKVGFLAMRMLLFALAQNQEWDAARNLVRKVFLDTGGPQPEGAHVRIGEQLFWQLATQLQLVDDLANV
jgi:pentatricopeptide repeat protein